MYELHPTRVFVHKRVYEHPKALVRLKRMLRALGDPGVEDVDTADTDRVLAAAAPGENAPVMSGSVRMGHERRCEDPVFLFNTFVWDDDARLPVENSYSHSCATRIARLMAGVGEDFAFSRREPAFGEPDGAYVCQGGWGIHSLKGCVHKCDYCEEGYIVNFMLDLEDFAEHVGAMMQRRPEQKVYRYDLYSDSICFEPEYGASAVLSELFARTDDKYLLYYTKSNNVQHLLDLPHKDHSIFYCTLSTETVCRKIERDTPSMADRIEGLRLCQEAGYVVRVGFSPIIPVRNWRKEATECLEELFTAVRPDTVRLWVMSLMSAEEMESLIDVALLDPGMVDRARAARIETPDHFGQPFPLDAREEIYAHYLDEARRISPQTPVSLCSENRQLWESLADRLNMTPEALYCCCGGVSVPRG